MRRFFRSLLIWLGIVLIVATAGLTVWNLIQINSLVATASAATATLNPRYWVLLAVAGGLLGGFTLGAGVGLPKRTFKQRLEEHTEQAAASEDDSLAG
jgi:hypothetical protein